MKKVYTKACAIIGMALSIVAIYGLLGAALYILFPDLLDDGKSYYDPILSAWSTIIFSIIVSAFSMIFYFIDGIISLIKSFMKIDKIFNLLLSAAIFVGAALAIMIVATTLTRAKEIIWLVYYLLLSVFETVSLIRCIKQRQKKKIL